MLFVSSLFSFLAMVSCIAFFGKLFFALFPFAFVCSLRAIIISFLPSFLSFLCRKQDKSASATSTDDFGCEKRRIKTALSSPSPDDVSSFTELMSCKSISTWSAWCDDVSWLRLNVSLSHVSVSGSMSTFGSFVFEMFPLNKTDDTSSFSAWNSLLLTIILVWDGTIWFDVVEQGALWRLVVEAIKSSMWTWWGWRMETVMVPSSWLLWCKLAELTIVLLLNFDALVVVVMAPPCIFKSFIFLHW